MTQPDWPFIENGGVGATKLGPLAFVDDEIRPIAEKHGIAFQEVTFVPPDEPFSVEPLGGYLTTPHGKKMQVPNVTSDAKYLGTFILHAERGTTGLDEMEQKAKVVAEIVNSYGAFDQNSGPFVALITPVTHGYCSWMYGPQGEYPGEDGYAISVYERSEEFPPKTEEA